MVTVLEVVVLFCQVHGVLLLLCYSIGIVTY